MGSKRVRHDWVTFTHFTDWPRCSILGAPFGRQPDPLENNCVVVVYVSLGTELANHELDNASTVGTYLFCWDLIRVFGFSLQLCNCQLIASWCLNLSSIG